MRATRTGQAVAIADAVSRVVAVAVAAFLVAAVADGCVGAGASVSPASPAPASPAASATSTVASPGTSAPTVTVTEWGPILDALPRSFPVYPGAEEVPDVGGPSSARLTVPATVARASAWWVTALRSAGYRSVAAASPLEDGSVVVDGSGTGSCRVRVRIGPTGGTTTATILYGASCPVG